MILRFALTVWFLFLAIFVSPAAAGTFYVSHNGQASWAACEHDAAPAGPKAGISACSVKNANQNAAAGDVIYIRGGQYTIDDTLAGDHPGINPANSGEPGNPIAYKNYENEEALFTGDGTLNRSIAVYLKERSHINVSGLDFTLCNQFLLIDGRQRRQPFADVGADYNVVDNCTFRHVRYRDNDGQTTSWRGSTIYHNAKHNWIHHCTFQAYGAFTDNQDVGVLFELGIGTDSTDQSNYNTIENNHMYQGGHHVLGVNTGRYNVVRNNYVHNESWYGGPGCRGFENGVCGYRVVSMTGTPAYSGHSLIEGNFISHGAANGGPHLTVGGSGSGLTVGTPGNIVRYNYLYGNALFGLRYGASIAGSNDNRVYNNTFYHNGYGADDDEYALDSYRGGIAYYGNDCAGIGGNVTKNNLIHDHWAERNRRTGSSYYPAIFTVNAAVDACNTVENNYVDGAGYETSNTPWEGSPDPEFTDPDISDPMALSLVDGQWTGKPDLSLKATSKAIGGGTWLTQTDGSGSQSTTLVVDDAGYFQDGTWGSALATLEADWIAIGSVTNIAGISAIDYAARTITLATPTSWNDNDPVWLYKNSKAETVLKGSAPDMGAHEYKTAANEPDPAPPANNSGGSDDSGGSGGGCFLHSF